MIKSSDGKSFIDGMNLVQGAASVRHDGSVLQTIGLVIDANNQPRFFNDANYNLAFGMYDKPAAYIMQKMELASNFTYSISGQCAPVGSTVYFTRDSDVNDVRELKDHIYASADSDDEGKFNVSLRGHDGIMYAWVKSPTTLDYTNLGKIRCKIDESVADTEETEEEDIIFDIIDTVNSVNRICTTCGGTGEGTANVTVDCPVCGGDGKVETDEGECQDCEGCGYDIIQVDCETCSGAGEIEYTGDMVWYDYGDIIAPDINTVWTDELKETHKFAMIKEERDGYLRLYLTPDTPTKDEDSTDGWNTSGGYKHYYCNKYSDGWKHSYSTTQSTSVYLEYYNKNWVSEELYNLDGTVYAPEVTGDGSYSAAEPVIYYDATKSYNGIVMPALSDWDKDERPYAVLLYNKAYVSPQILVSEEPFYFSDTVSTTGGTCLVNDAGDDGLVYEKVDDRFEVPDGVTVNDVLETINLIPTASACLIWSNHDVVMADGSIFMEETQAVPIHRHFYNGVTLPELPGTLDTHLYKIIVCPNDEYVLLYMQDALVIGGDKEYTSVHRYICSDNMWVYDTEITITPFDVDSSYRNCLIWSNHNVLVADEYDLNNA